MKIFVMLFSLMFPFKGFTQEKLDEYQLIYRENDTGEMTEDSLLKCPLLIQEVKKGMSFLDVEEYTGKPSEVEEYSIGNENKIVVWNYIHNSEIDHSIEFWEGRVSKVILNYPKYQKELSYILTEKEN